MNNKQQAFVCEMLRHGNKAEAYRAAYKPQSDNLRSLESAANRLMKNPEVEEAIQSVQDRIYAEVRQELKTHMLREALTLQRKREILAQIAEGEWTMQPPPEGIEGKPTAVLIPTLKERLKAIDMDNRMTGTYANARSTAPELQEQKNHNKTQQSPAPPTKEPLPEKYPVKPEVYIPAADGKKYPFIMPAIHSRDPLLNRSAVKHSKLMPSFPSGDPYHKTIDQWRGRAVGVCESGVCPNDMSSVQQQQSKPAWLQTIRV